MLSVLCDVITSITNFFVSFVNLVGPDMLFIIALGVEVVFVLFFLIKSAFSYEAQLNRALDKLNYWLFEKKVVTEDNIKELNMLFKTKTPKRLCYYWQQYILFREGEPSKYLSVENLVEKPLKTSSYNSNIKNLSLFTTIWAGLTAMFVLLSTSSESSVLLGKSVASAIMLPMFVGVLGLIFVVVMRARKSAILNALYQNVSLFGRFMDNACVDLPSYIDYQILFTPEEIQKGQPVLREFLDYKARKEKEEFNRAKEEKIDYQTYDFSATGVDGSIVLDRAMKESELFLKRQDKILVKVSQLESELDSRRKNFDAIQKEFQTKIQASKENVNRLRQMQEETTNRIESNFYRKQQTQEISKQEQLEQEFEQQKTKYLLEKSECEEEIKKYNDELEQQKQNVQNIMLGEYQTFFDKFCHSAEKVVGQVFADKFAALKKENEEDKQKITELEIKLKNIPQGAYDADQPNAKAQPVQTNEEIPAEGMYDENGNYVYPNGTYYDTNGHFHDENGNVYTQDGQLVEEAKPEEKEPEKKIVNFDDMDDFDFMTDVSQKGAIYGVAENVINDVDKEGDVQVVNNNKLEKVVDEKTIEEAVENQDSYGKPAAKIEPKKEEPKPEKVEQPVVNNDFEELAPVEKVETEPKVEPAKEEKVEEKEEKPKKKAGRPRKIVQEQEKPAGKRGRPKKVVVEKQEPEQEKKKPGRPKKIVNKPVEEAPKRGRGRPKKNDIDDINARLSAEEAKIAKMRSNLNKELEKAVNGINSIKADAKQTKREELIKEIEELQEEARNVIQKNEPESKIEEINAKIEALMQEVKDLN